MQYHGCRSHIKDRSKVTELEDKFDLLVDANDAILERVVSGPRPCEESLQLPGWCLSMWAGWIGCALESVLCVLTGRGASVSTARGHFASSQSHRDFAELPVLTLQGILLDEAAGVNKNQQPVLPSGLQAPKTIVSSWNRKVSVVRCRTSGPGEVSFPACLHPRLVQSGPPSAPLVFLAPPQRGLRFPPPSSKVGIAASGQSRKLSACSTPGTSLGPRSSFVRRWTIPTPPLSRSCLSSPML